MQAAGPVAAIAHSSASTKTFMATSSLLLASSSVSTSTEDQIEETVVKTESPSDDVFTVPFYSQFADITVPQWQKVGCGIASVAMLIDFYTEAVSVDALLEEGIASNAYLSDAGWTHAGLIALAERRGLVGQTVSLAGYSRDGAFAELEKVLQVGPVMASVHYTFEPTNPIPHLVVINGVKDGLVYYNDPAEQGGGGSLSIEKFQNAWKKRYISIRPSV